jgi:hypothetical protein
MPKRVVLFFLYFNRKKYSFLGWISGKIIKRYITQIIAYSDSLSQLGEMLGDLECAILNAVPKSVFKNLKMVKRQIFYGLLKKYVPVI